MANSLTREDFDGGPISYDEIEPNLYLGNVTAATHMDTLKSLNIKYVLTLDSIPLPMHITGAPFLKAKFVQVSDVPKEDLLHFLDECLSFIDEALSNEKAILVHCYFGVSRSATIVIAYIMKKYKLRYTHAYEKVKAKRRLVGPNSGFVFQLKLFYQMGFKIDSQNEKYKCYRLKLAADKVRKVKILPQSCMDLVKSDPGLTQENPETIVYRCRKCRRIVANKSNVITHMLKKNNETITQTNSKSNEPIKPKEEPTFSDVDGSLFNQERKSIENERSYEIKDEICKNIIFVEPIAWMTDILKQVQGRLNCPKCSQKLGSFSWINGCQCPCKTLVAPAFYLIPSKVELSTVVQNVQMTV